MIKQFLFFTKTDQLILKIEFRYYSLIFLINCSFKLEDLVPQTMIMGKVSKLPKQNMTKVVGGFLNKSIKFNIL